MARPCTWTGSHTRACTRSDHLPPKRPMLSLGILCLDRSHHLDSMDAPVREREREATRTATNSGHVIPSVEVLIFAKSPRPGAGVGGSGGRSNSPIDRRRRRHLKFSKKASVRRKESFTYTRTQCTNGAATKQSVFLIRLCPIWAGARCCKLGLFVGVVRDALKNDMVF